MNANDFLNNYGQQQASQSSDDLSSRASATTGGFNVSYGQTPEQVNGNNQLLIVAVLIVGMAGIVLIASKGS